MSMKTINAIEAIEHWLATIVQTELVRWRNTQQGLVRKVATSITSGRMTPSEARMRAGLKSISVKKKAIAPIKGVASKAPGRANGKSKGHRVPPKYRDVATGDTWAGRGNKPRWLVARLKQGRSLKSFAIKTGRSSPA